MLSIMKNSTVNLEENGIDESKYSLIFVNIILVSGRSVHNHDTESGNHTRKNWLIKNFF